MCDRVAKFSEWVPEHGAVTCHERTTVERVYGRLKEEFGGRHVRVRGHAKVLCHLMFGILALAVSQLMRLLPPL